MISPRPILRAMRIPLALLLLLSLSASSALANGKPITVVMTYLPELSNWGPQNATGVAEIISKEGEVRVTVTGLPVLDGEVYTAWMLNTKTADTLPVLAFNTDETRSAKVANILKDEIPDKGWNVLLLTVEAARTSGTKPSDRRSIAGYLPNEEPGSGSPQQLPKTGGESIAAGSPPTPPAFAAPRSPTSESTPWVIYVGAGIGLLVLLGAAYRVGLSRGRR